MVQAAAKRVMESLSAGEIIEAAREAAKSAGLRYTNDIAPGIHRQRTGRGFRYIGLEGKPVRDVSTLQRIKALAIPPAWTDVWICPWPNGHLQATGRDAKGRKQYRYHTRWRAVRDETKFERVIAFGKALPHIREEIEHDLQLPGLPREKVLATVVRLLETTFIRVGNEEYARTNGSYGLTTMRDAHVKINGANLRFQFRGKSGVRHAIDLNDRRLARIVSRCQELPGQELFQYIDEEGNPQCIGSADVNAYLREICDEDFTAKDFRTWAGTVLMASALQEYKICTTPTEARKNLNRAIESVAAQLGNTPSVCRKSYIHPTIINLYLDGSLITTFEFYTKHDLKNNTPHIQPHEAIVLAILKT